MPPSVSSVPALDRGLDVLEALQSAPDGLGISELAAQLGASKNSIFRITHALTARGYLLRDVVSKRFHLSSKFLTMGQPRVADQSLVEVALGPMRQLRDDTRETVQLGIRVGDEGVIIEQAAGLCPLRITVDIGLRFPLHNNAPGKVLLTWGAEPVATAVRRLTLTPYTPRTITSEDGLISECERVIRAGYATDFAEADEGIHCVAAPILRPTGKLIAAVWLSAPSRRLSKSLFAAAGRQVVHCAHSIAERLRH